MEERAWITSHFGKNPKNGGSPPKDIKEKNIENLITGFILVKENVWLIWFKLNILNNEITHIDKNE